MKFRDVTIIKGHVFHYYIDFSTLLILYVFAAATFVRERCDSLPSRNRSSSECNNQNFRNAATLSSYRSNTIQRISNSPPIVCSESEESSISIDESDDAITFLPFRLR